MFTPHRILATFPVELGGEIITVEVELVNAPLDYNLLLECSWFYPIKSIGSTIYRFVHFHHQGKIVSIDQLDYCMPNLWIDSTTNIPLVSESYKVPQLVGASLFKDLYLMGVFPLPILDAIVTPINMISFVGTHLDDPWVILNLSEIESYCDTMPLSLTKLSYFVIQSETESDVCFSQEDELDQYSLPKWAKNPSSLSHDFFSKNLLSDEAILKAMMMSESPWEDYPHRSSILPMVSPINTILTLS